MITFEVVARTGQTVIPEGVGKFTLLGQNPAIDSLGNVLFTGVGGSTPTDSFQSGVYKAGATIERVAARGMDTPGGNQFDRMLGASIIDINNGAAAFTADVSLTTTKMGAYTTLGGTLRQVAIADGVDVHAVGDPVIDGEHVLVRVTKAGASSIRDWSNGTHTDTGPVGGLNVALNTQVDADAGNLIFRRYNATISDLAINNAISLAAIGQAAPGGGKFFLIGFNPAISGLNAAFSANTTLGAGVFQWIDGALSQLAHVAAPVGSLKFTGFHPSGVGLVGKVCAFLASPTTNLLRFCLYANMDGIQKIAGAGDTILGLPVANVGFSGKGIARTSRGYEFAFFANLGNLGGAIFRAIVPADGPPPPPPPPPPPEPDYSITVKKATNTVTMTSTRGTVAPASAVAAPEATFTTTEAGGVRTHRVRVE